MARASIAAIRRGAVNSAIAVSRGFRVGRIYSKKAFRWSVGKAKSFRSQASEALTQIGKKIKNKSLRNYINLKKNHRFLKLDNQIKAIRFKAQIKLNSWKGVQIPNGQQFNGKIYRAVPHEYAGVETRWNMPPNKAANHRYTGKGRNGLYASQSEEGVLRELNAYNANINDFTIVSDTFRLDNLLDLTDVNVLRSLGVKPKDLVLKGSRTRGKIYSLTQAIGEFAAKNYSGILSPSAQVSNATHIIYLKGGLR